MTTNFWAIADPHLSFAKPRDMARFGGKWIDHESQLRDHWCAQVAPNSIVLIPGDVSWAGSPNKAAPDLQWLAALPGYKVLLRGNHDHWWKNIAVARKIADPLGIQLLEGDSIRLSGVTVCGAMGHIAPEDPYYAPDPKKDRYQRELARLEAALTHGNAQREGGPLILIMHYPPFTSEGKPTAYSALIEAYKPTLCLYGHLHRSKEWELAVEGERNGIIYRLVAADYLEMKPLHVFTSAE